MAKRIISSSEIVSFLPKIQEFKNEKDNRNDLRKALQLEDPFRRMEEVKWRSF